MEQAAPEERKRRLELEREVVDNVSLLVFDVPSPLVANTADFSVIAFMHRAPPVPPPVGSFPE